MGEFNKEIKISNSLLRLLLVVTCSMSILQVKSQQRQIYVAPNGSDNAAGTIGAPLASLRKAVNNIKNVKDKEVIIELRGGTYQLDTTILLTPAMIGDHKVTIRNYNNEVVILSGNKTLVPGWKKFRDSIYVADVGKGLTIDRLFANDRQLRMARYPDYDSTARVFNGTAEDAIAPARLAGWQHPEGAYFHALHQGEWGDFHYIIKGIDASGEAILEGGWQNNRPSPLHKKLRFVENVFEELNAPNEWFYDRPTGMLYLVPASSADLQKKYSYSFLDDLIVIKGDKEAPVKNIVIQGIRFSGTNRTFMLTREPLLRTDWAIYRGGAILLDGTENVRIADCDFNSLGGNAIFVSNYNQKVQISGNHISDIGASGIAFIGSPNAVRSPSFQYSEFVPYNEQDKQPGPKTQEYPFECTAENNLIHDIGTVEKQVSAVVSDMSSRILVAHNSIYNTPRAGINIGDGCWGGHILEYNDVFNTVLETGDHGAFNSWGRDRFWLPNGATVDSMVALNPKLPFLDVVEPITLRNNRFQCAHGWDIDLDDGSSNYRVYNNLCLEGGIKLREGYDRIVRNNVLVNNSFHPHVWFKNSGDVFSNNIVSADYAPISINDWGSRIDSNFFLQEVSLKAAQGYGTDAHSMHGDPQFVNPGINDYQVKNSSATKKVGFRNFSMNSFGVTGKRLMPLARKPLATGIKIYALTEKGQTSEFLGAIIKNIEGLGERSAAGLPDEDGILVISVKQGSLADSSGLKPRDVIRKINGKEVKDMVQLVATMQVETWHGEADATVIRDQVEKTVLLKLK
jgi:hypothetical protein